MMEGRPMVCYWTGAINSVVYKLAQLKKDHPKVEELLQDLERLRTDLLNKFAGRHEKDEQLKVWMKQVRELVYDIEDWLDPMLLEGDQDDCIVPELPTNFWESEAEWERQIKEFKSQIQEARDRCARYDLLDKAVNSDDSLLVDACPSDVAVDCGSIIWGEKSTLVGLGGPISELENHLNDELKKLKVVSILGSEGHGKTTLAREIYGKLKWQFECHAFVSVGLNSSTRSILEDIIRQVHWKMDPSDFSERADWDEQQLITDIWEFLGAKRYFIFIDDIRSSWAWRVINAALPNNNLGSRILTTTRIKEVAVSCSRRPSDVVYDMKPLSEDDSRSLFLTMTSVRKAEQPVDFEKVNENMLNICGGLPLAIMVTAGLLTNKSAELGPSKVLEKSMPFLMDQYSKSEGMRKILDISFADLPRPVKSCFLYLSAFPRNYTIKKDCLIRRWIAEGLIPQRDQKCSWETGESYFKELLTRRLIQAVFDDNDDQAVGCTIHGVIHEFIASLSSKENFVTLDAELSSGLVPCDTIRRFSVSCSKHEEISTLESCSVHLRRVRSLRIFKGAKWMPDLSAFELIRVLDVAVNKELSYDQLRSIGSLTLLRYLRLRGTGRMIELPREIGQLEGLNTIDVRKNSVTSLPTFTTTKLVSVLADNVELPGGMGEMQELEELSTIELSSGDGLDDIAELVSKSKKLRMLGVRFDYFKKGSYESHRQGLAHFLHEVGESSLQSLYLDCEQFHLVDLLLDYCAHTSLDHLRKFVLMASYGSLQKFAVKMASLVSLTHLHIEVESVEAEGLLTLGNLPNLVFLKLGSNSTWPRCIISSDGFQCLKVFGIECGALQFEEGAMPQLRRLQLLLNMNVLARCRDFNFGIRHLSCLVNIRASFYCRGAKASDVEAVETAVKDELSRIPNSPLLELSREFEHLVRTDEHESSSFPSHITIPAEATTFTQIVQTFNEGELTNSTKTGLIKRRQRSSLQAQLRSASKPSRKYEDLTLKDEEQDEDPS